MPHQPKKSLYERALDADIRAGMHLGNANEASEAGNQELADKLYAKSQFWLDRYILLSNQGDRPAPKR